MTRRYATKTLILTYLRVAGEPRPMLLIRKYMLKMHKIGPAATRTAVWRLCQEGEIERVSVGFYRWVAPAQVSLNEPAPTDHKS